MEVVRMAAMVPIGMDREASARSPDLLEPAIIPVTTNQHCNPNMQSLTKAANFLNNHHKRCNLLHIFKIQKVVMKLT